MSEVRYRGLLRRIFGHPRSLSRLDQDYAQFVGAVLESHLPMVVQLGMVLARNDVEISRQAVQLIHTVRIHELVPDLIETFKTADVHEGAFLKQAILVALDYLRHDQIHAFMLGILQAPGEIAYRRTAARSLKQGQKRPEMPLHFLIMAENTAEVTELRCYAIEGLLHHGGADVLPLLVPLLQDQEGQVRWTALREFENQGNDVFASCLEPLIDDPYTWKVMDTRTIGSIVQHLLRKWDIENSQSDHLP